METLSDPKTIVFSAEASTLESAFFPTTFLSLPALFLKIRSVLSEDKPILPDSALVLPICKEFS